MKKTLGKLWNEYLFDECAAIDTDEERALLKKTVDLHEKLNALLDKEAIGILEEYAEILSTMEAYSVKKAFFKGCEFAVTFILESAAR